MSAIWGMIDFDCKIEKNTALKMEEAYRTYQIDTFRNHFTANAVFGYCGQYFTKEAYKEILPIADSQALFVADAVLDNRDELFDRLGIKAEDRDGIPDGTLIYQLLKTYGRQSLPMFLGTYAFAYYDPAKKEVMLVTDSVGSRCLYYCCDKTRMYFSTLIRPIIAAREEQTEWNYRFLSDYLALDNLAHYTEAEETPYHNLYKIAPGQAVVINQQGIHKENYWKAPYQCKILRKSDREFKQEFIHLFDQCVTDIMRSSGETGILLSGGLDSTSVACFAAPKLKEQGKMLYSYTSVPEKEYEPEEGTHFLENEQKMVEKTGEFLGNLSSTFLDLQGVNGFDGAAEYMERLEIPYKSLQNVRWIRECGEKAAADGCRIMLTGQYGNTTISFGEIEMHLYTLLRTGRLLELSKEVNAFAFQHHYSRKKIYTWLLSKMKFGLLKNSRKKEQLFSNVYINPELIERFNMMERFRKENKASGSKDVITYRQFRPLIAVQRALVQIGEFETRLSLETGVLLRDPTRDRRMIEFCVGLPENQFVYRGVERRLVREYLKDYLPKDVLECRCRGVQSADMRERITKNWDQIYRECIELLEEKAASTLLDVPKIRHKLDAFRDGPSNGSNFELTKLLYSVLAIKYVKLSENIAQNKLLHNC